MVGIGNAFAYDDVKLIQENVRLHSTATWAEIFRSPFWPPPYQPDLYRPLTAWLLSLQHLFGAGEPTVFRVVSYVLYAVVSLGVLRLASRIMPTNVAWGIALLFAAHPVHVEAVALAVGQAELVVALLTVSAVCLYVDRRRDGFLSVTDWTILVAMYLAASLFKEQGLLLPAVIIAAELLLVGSATEASARVRRLAPGVVAMSAVGVAVLAVRRAVLGDVAGSFVAEALAGASFSTRFLTMLRLVPAWLRLMTWPAHLQADYSPREIVASHSLGVIEIVGLVLLAGAIALAWRVRRSNPAAAFGVAFMGIMLFPVSNLVVPTGIVLAERVLFLPSIGFVIAVGAGVSDPRVAAAWQSISARIPALAEPRLMPAAMIALVSLGAIKSAMRQRVWRNDAIFAVRTVQDAPLSFRAQQSYGDVAFAVNQPRLGVQAYERALVLAPPDEQWRVRKHFARGLALAGDRAAAAAQLRASLAQRPDQDDTRGLLVAAELALGHYDAAKREADEAIAHGGREEVFGGLRRLADSASRSGAPPGSVNVGIALAGSRRSP